MSFILDALKKSENERQEQSAAEFAGVPASSDEPRAPRWLWVLAVLLAINVVVLAGLLMRDDTPNIVSATADTPAVVQEQEPAPSFADKIEEARERHPVVVARADTEPGTEEPEPSPAPADPAQTPQPEFTLRSMPTAAELRADGTIQMAELHLDIHVYSDVPDDRFVFINMVRHKENSRLTEGPVVREITPEGVILDYLGTEFLLPRE